MRPAARMATRPVVATGAIMRVLAAEVLVRATRLPTMARLMGAPLSSASELSTLAVTSPASLDLTESERRRLRAVGHALHRSPFGSTCLRRALCAGNVLRRRRPRLVVGVAKHDGAVSAHAWIVVGGVNLDPDGSADFRPLTFDRGSVPA